MIVVMEYLHGGELHDFWVSRKDCKISEREAKEIMS
jgi:serine/threonine protein kinase